jgi:SNF family Na+-dependent transporter
MNKLIQRSFLNVLGVVAYVSGVALIMSNGNKIFGEKDTAVTPIAALMLFVLSAAVTGSLVIGKPLLMYLNNQKSEAVKLFIYTLCWLALATIVLFVVMASMNK